MSAFADFEAVDIGQPLPVEDGPFLLDEDDFLLYGMLLDPVYHPELMWRDTENFEYAGQYRVRDYQFIINRLEDQHGREENYAIVSCARSVGKTESEKVHMEIHPLKEYGNMLVTAPELIHLLPLTDAVEDNIQDSTLLRELLDTRNGQTGFQHRPFQANFDDGTKIVGRIPRIKGTGVKGQHQKKLIVEEGQDYPEAGWTEVNEAQPLDAPVLTPQGFVPMGSIETGDIVIGPDGDGVQVVGIAHQKPRQVCRVHFSDGASADCDENHLWTVCCNRHAAAGKWRTLTTRQIEDGLRRKRGFGSLRQPWFVPRGAAALLEERTLPLDPYLLGLLLGDGSLRHGSVKFTTADRELVEAVTTLIDPEEELVHEGGYDYRIRRRHHRSRWHLPRTRWALIELGLWGHLAHEKFVPEPYLRASLGQRHALLQGLVDSDGHVDSSGAVTFSSSSAALAEAVAQLAWSLGGALSQRVATDARGYRDRHVVRFRLPSHLQPARLTRKAHSSTSTVDSMRRKIVAVERLERWEPMQCLKLASDDGLYLTKDYLVTHNTVNYDALDRDGNADFTFWIYGVHSGDRSSQFDEYARSALYRKIKVTALRRPDWGAERKANAIAAYGGTSSPDYKRNILGEPGSGATSYFVVARVMACVDQNTTRGEVTGSDYNERIYVKQKFRAEELDDLDMKIGELLDLPKMTTGGWWGGVDIGLTDSPTVITLFAEWQYQKKQRLTLMRRFTLERFRPKQIREALYAIGWHFGTDLLGIGIDVTGLGRPIFQDMEDDELCPPHLRDVTVGYTFNSNVEVAVSPSLVTENQGVLRDHLGNMVKVIEDEVTGEKSYVVMQPFIAASTQFIRDDIDDGTYLLPFDTDVISDMLQETKQRVERVGKRGEGGGQRVKKGDRFHILDAIRAMAYRRRQDEILAKLAPGEQQSVLDVAGLEDGLLDLGSFTPEQIAGVLGQI